MNKGKNTSTAPPGVVMVESDPSDWIAGALLRKMGASGSDMTARVERLEHISDAVYSAMFGEGDGLIVTMSMLEEKVDAYDDDTLHQRINKVQGQLGVLAKWMERYTPFLSGLERAFEQQRDSVETGDPSTVILDGVDEWKSENLQKGEDDE
jgi:hypothetical protein